MAATGQLKMLKLQEGPVPPLDTVFVPDYGQMNLKSITSSATEVEKHIKIYKNSYQVLLSNMMMRSIPSLYSEESEVLRTTCVC